MLSRSAALFCEMGTGKTFISINVAEILHYYGRIDRVLVVVPLSLIDTWSNELKKYTTNSRWWKVLGSKNKRLEALQCYAHHKLNWYLINIDALNTIHEELGMLDPDMVIIDESTIIKNRVAKRTKKCVELFASAKYKIIMSGNPIPKSADEIYAQYAFLDCGIFGTRFTEFRDRYFEVDYFSKITSLKNPTEFYEKMHSIAFRRTKEECLDLPPKIYISEQIIMEEEQARLYKAMEKDALASYQDITCAAPVVITKMLRLSQIAGGHFPEEEAGKALPLPKNPKLNRLLELLEEIPKHDQIVIWARFQAELKSIQKALQDAGHKCVLFYGGTSVEDRTIARQKFREKDVRIFIGNPATGGRGLNDLIGATTVIYYSNDFSAENRMQSEDRTHRHGTVGDKVTYIDLLMKGTIDTLVFSVLRNNRDFSEMLLSREITFENNML